MKILFYKLILIFQIMNTWYSCGFAIIDYNVAPDITYLLLQLLLRPFHLISYGVRACLCLSDCVIRLCVLFVMMSELTV